MSKKFCPFSGLDCNPECALWIDLYGQCAFAIQAITIAEQNGK